MSKPINPYMKRLIEATIDAIYCHLPTALQNEVVVIGGAAVLLLNHPRLTEDVDLRATNAAHYALHLAFEQESRFRFSPDGLYEFYATPDDISIKIEFVGQRFVAEQPE